MQGFNLITGLTDLSKELGESTVKTTTQRVSHFNDAVVEFANEKKWPFLVKVNEELTSVTGTQTYDIPDNMLADMRVPEPVKQIFIGDSTIPINPQYYSINLEDETITFENAINVTGSVFHIHYYYIPTRLTDTNDTTTLFPILSRYRKPLGTLAAAFVQWSRYLDGPGNRLYNLYQKQLGKIERQQGERPTGKPRRLGHFLQYLGFKRTYP